MTNEHWIKGITLVIGGTGKTGRRVADRLLKAGRQVRIGSRSAEIPFDWEQQDTWDRALQNVKAVYVAYQPDLAVPGALETVEALFDRAIASGVEKLVLLSGRGEVEAEEAERALQKTSADWTILRSSWFFQNFSESFFLDPILAGQVALPVMGSVAEPFVDVDDIADIAYAALTDVQHSRQLYEITGSKALTFPEAIDEIARATGQKITFVPIPADDYRAELVRQGVPDDYIELVLYLFSTVLDGRNTPLADGVQRALGRPPRNFADYVRQTAASGIWGGK
ncbi:NAD(P)H-binding protein [Chamaesiphon minutus]|uniref:Putative nucleoside-diphosphate sugar epimerase n=1 Tax=Chamaesiphon minutus (strain ATCC 27169 / PCC 6605) TaxID=1173020 RepID=K9UD11_CHAP6|nr:NAD(P)H-binding protein [Chamaesiphon minutus]AFY92997.1 putative nucleoside-diphosphate sugar epimerase [Chamaesiphon minutus PCC 6605]